LVNTKIFGWLIGGKISMRMRLRASAPPPTRATTIITMVIGWRSAKTIGFTADLLSEGKDEG